MATRWSWSKWLFPNRYCDVVSIWLFSENFNNLQQSDAKIEWKLQKHIHSFTLSPFLFMPPFSKCIIYCRTPNFCYSNCKFVVGIIIVSPTTTLYSLLYYYSPNVQFWTDQQKKFNYSAPIRDIELKFWGYAQLALT